MSKNSTTTTTTTAAITTATIATEISVKINLKEKTMKESCNHTKPCAAFALYGYTTRVKISVYGPYCICGKKGHQSLLHDTQFGTDTYPSEYYVIKRRTGTGNRICKTFEKHGRCRGCDCRFHVFPVNEDTLNFSRKLKFTGDTTLFESLLSKFMDTIK